MINSSLYISVYDFCNHRIKLIFIHETLSHNERDGASNRQGLDCLFNHLFRGRSKKTSKLRVTGLCEGKPTTGKFPAQRESNMGKFFHLMTSSWYRGIIYAKSFIFHDSCAGMLKFFFLSCNIYIIYAKYTEQHCVYEIQKRCQR